MGIVRGIVSLDNLVISLNLLSTIAEIDEFKGAWQQLGRMMCLKTYGKVGVGEIQILTNINRNTLKKALAHLVKTGVIDQHGVGRATKYMYV